MPKIRDVIVVLNNYQKIAEIISGEKNHEMDEFIQLLKSYRTLGIDEFRKKLERNTSKDKRISSRQQAIQLGGSYYQLKLNDNVTENEKFSLVTFLALPENKSLQRILDLSFDECFKAINEIPDKSITIPHLIFLGMALLNIKLKGRTKADYKKNLLDVLWTVAENQKMNEIYENGL